MSSEIAELKNFQLGIHAVSRQVWSKHRLNEGKLTSSSSQLACGSFGHTSHPNWTRLSGPTMIGSAALKLSLTFLSASPWTGRIQEISPSSCASLRQSVIKQVKGIRVPFSKKYATPPGSVLNFTVYTAVYYLARDQLTADCASLHVLPGGTMTAYQTCAFDIDPLRSHFTFRCPASDKKHCSCPPSSMRSRHAFSQSGRAPSSSGVYTLRRFTS